MKRFMRLYDEDLRAIIMEKYDLRPSQVTSVYTEEVDDNENVKPIFYIEVEEDER